jgi:hypothetical protein
MDVRKSHIKFSPSECYCVQNCSKTQLWNMKKPLNFIMDDANNEEATGAPLPPPQ